ncbi:MAG: sugar transferase [Thermodesulfobacteriota bacterium]|nr:sugar transferase [Thermodesulfobacteriota bacterium]
MVKRTLDIVASVAGLLLLSPLLVMLTLIVKIKLGSPILFKQMRPGLYGDPFVAYKFRTMTDERDGDGNLLPDGVRLTRLGRIVLPTKLLRARQKITSHFRR